MSALEAERCWAEIELAALRHNAAVARERAGAGVALLAVVKTNAYGHGLTAIVRTLADQAQLFGVANLREALAVRAVAPHPVVIMGTALPAERSGIVQAGFIPSVSSYEEASEFGSYAAGSQKVAIACIIDTGMGRMGVAERDAVAEVRRIMACPGVELYSISTHLPVADEDPEFTRRQLERFSALVARLRGEFPGAFQVHALPSAGVISFPGDAHEIVRAGLMLYGISPIAEFQPQLRPALTWKARVILVRELAPGSSVSYGRTFIADRQMRVATLSVGYADGLPRSLSNRGAVVLIGGRRCPILGRVTMDMTMVDVSGVPEVSSGDEAVLLGRQGTEEILASEMAACASTIAWEIFTGIGSRVERVYL